MTLEIEVGEDSNSEHPHDSRDTQKLTLQKTTRARCRTTIAALWFWCRFAHDFLPPFIAALILRFVRFFLPFIAAGALGVRTCAYDVDHGAVFSFGLSVRGSLVFAAGRPGER
jgi:hypothetical protein